MYQDSPGESTYRPTSRASHTGPARGVVIERQPVTRSPDDSALQAEAPGAALAEHTSHWRSTFAGALAASTALLFLGLLGLGLGLSGFNAATASTEGALPAGMGRNVGIWLAFSLLAAFLIGGYVAARSALVRHSDDGAWRGVLVFMLASPLLVWLLVGGLAGAAASLAGTLAGLHLDPATQARVNPTAFGDMAGHLRDVTWGAFGGSVLGLLGSALGGMLAAPQGTLRRPGREHEHEVSRHAGMRVGAGRR